MAAPTQPRIDHQSSEHGSLTSPEDDQETASSSASKQLPPGARCTELSDLLGDYSEQTGSFFG